MTFPNKTELQEVAFNQLSDIDFEDFVNLYKNCTTKPYSFLVIDSTLTSNDFYVLEKSFRKDIKTNYDKGWGD